MRDFICRKVGYHDNIKEAIEQCQAISPAASPLKVENLDDGLAALAAKSGKWRIQGKTMDLCWKDTNGEKMNHPDLDYPSLENSTLVIDMEINTIGEASESDSIGFICQREKNGQGISSC